MRAYLKDICHACAKYKSLLSDNLGILIPVDRVLPVFLAKEPAGLIHAPDILPGALGECGGITILTAFRNLHTSPPGIERMICPCNLRVFHILILLETPGAIAQLVMIECQRANSLEGKQDDGDQREHQ
jgi:hypothetical protein